MTIIVSNGERVIIVVKENATRRETNPVKANSSNYLLLMTILVKLTL